MTHAAPRRNRVTPDGQIIADPARGLFMGNRGILHDAAGQILHPWRHKNWVTCLLSFKSRRRPLMAPHRYTELFFLDEAVALAAGHRPCAECRRSAYTAFRHCWRHAVAQTGKAADMDTALHRARAVPRLRIKLTYSARIADLPAGCFVVPDGTNLPHLITGGALRPFAMSGYGAPVAIAGHGTVLTPRPTVEVLRAGYTPALHPTAA
ncbi:hypothetical protein [Pseudogemmobacter sp. W21_MBD1_M6]|uniref:hypothetical protein n=1 Tax=Pseudogemmobacter sp. W21_MBD1_M6 TaxID=3240271 RepID=UPI003F9CC24B